jgi:hypothetical protein
MRFHPRHNQFPSAVSLHIAQVQQPYFLLTSTAHLLTPTLLPRLRSADGAAVLAGGESKHICIYAVRGGVLVKKYTVSRNRSLDGVLDMLNSKEMTEVLHPLASPTSVYCTDTALESTSTVPRCTTL